MLVTAGLGKWFLEGRKYWRTLLLVDSWSLELGYCGHFCPVTRGNLNWCVAAAISNFPWKHKTTITYGVITTAIISKILCVHCLNVNVIVKICCLSDIWLIHLNNCSKCTLFFPVNGESSTVTKLENSQYWTLLSFYFLCGQICISTLN